MDQRAAKVIIFAADVIENQWQDCGPSEDGQVILDHATDEGLVHWRKPTPAELADEEWWGHELEIDPETSGVGELTPEFRALVKEAKAALAATEEG